MSFPFGDPDVQGVEHVDYRQLHVDGVLPLDTVLTIQQPDGTTTEFTTNDGTHFYPRVAGG